MQQIALQNAPIGAFCHAETMHFGFLRVNCIGKPMEINMFTSHFLMTLISDEPRLGRAAVRGRWRPLPQSRDCVRAQRHGEGVVGIRGRGYRHYGGRRHRQLQVLYIAYRLGNMICSQLHS